MITAKVIRESSKETSWLQHDLEVGKEYEVESIEMGQSYTSIFLKNRKGSYNSVIFEFYEDGKELDIYSDERFNPYI